MFPQTHIPSETCFPYSERHITTDICSPNLEHTPLVICVSRVGGHRSQEIFVSQVTGGQFVCACVNIVCTALSVEVSANCLRSLQAFAGCFLELNDVFWELRSTNVFLKVSRYFYDESELLVGALLPLRGQSFLS